MARRSWAGYSASCRILGTSPLVEEGDVAGTDPEPIWGKDGVEGGEEVGEVGQGFPHTHENEVVDASSGFNLG